MEIRSLYANRNAQSDFVKNAIERLSDDSENVYIAVAFFTEASVIERLVEKGCNVRLIVRLGFPTSPFALERLINKNPEVLIRYFTSHSFHPKLYLFGDHTALVGSANLTHRAIMSNQEIVVSLKSQEDSRVTELVSIFDGYWAEAKVLSDTSLKDYKQLYTQFAKFQTEAEALDQRILDKLGNLAPSNIDWAKKKGSKESIFLDDFRRTYQECVTAFRTVQRIYEKTGYRKVPENVVPLRLEIDSFVSYIRDKHAKKEAWNTEPLRTGKAQEEWIRSFIDGWRETSWPHYEVNIAQENYPRVQNVFGTEARIRSVDDDDLIAALSDLHSFHDRLQFFEGGLKTLCKTFLKKNDPTRVRNSFAHLLFGAGSIEERMAALLFNPAYKLDEFGRANVQELVGWCGIDDRPVINGRTTKILKYLGFKVIQLDPSTAVHEAATSVVNAQASVEE